MRRTSLLFVAAVVAFTFTTSDAFADHFARQRAEAAARASAASHKHFNSHGHWGGPTTKHRFYPTHNHAKFHSAGLHTHGGSITVINRTHFAPRHPWCYGGYGYGGYGWGYGGYGRSLSVSPYGIGFPGGGHIHIHQEIRR